MALLECPSSGLNSVQWKNIYFGHYSIICRALAIKAGRITASGKTDVVEKLATKRTKHLNLNGMLVVPGFNDAHNHLPDCLTGNEIPLNENAMDPSCNGY
jgi:cytosine/adenosine deaminase-related metal-dependent hydrolase